MFLNEQYITDVLNNISTTIKPVTFRKWYFDAETFQSDSRYIYFGVLNSINNVTITSLEGNDSEVVGATNPLFLKNIVGDSFTFIGWQVEVTN
jgi:hypothetical protein